MKGLKLVYFSRDETDTTFRRPAYAEKKSPDPERVVSPEDQ